jgi:hypothetical protein
VEEERHYHYQYHITILFDHSGDKGASHKWQKHGFAVVYCGDFDGLTISFLFLRFSTGKIILDPLLWGEA